MRYIAKLSEVTKSYKRNPIFENMDLNLKKGTTIIAGDSSSGKTTLIKMILGLVKPDDGTVENYDQNIGYKPQQHGLYDHMSVRENFNVFLFKDVENKNTVDEILSDLDLVDLEETKVAKLTPIEKEVVSFGIAFIGFPDLVLLDEIDFEKLGSYKEQVVKFIKNLPSNVSVIATSSPGIPPFKPKEMYMINNNKVESVDISKLDFRVIKSDIRKLIKEDYE